MRSLNELNTEGYFSTKVSFSNSHKLLIGALALIFVAGMASPAFALVIDNFDEGAVLIDTANAAGSNTANNAGLNTDNTLGGDRDTMITSDGPAGVIGQIILNDFMTFSAQAITTGSYMLTYDGPGAGGLGGIDLTLGGGADRITITFVDADFQSTVTVSITEQNGDEISDMQMTSGGPQLMVFKFADMSGTGDASTPEDADIIKITIDSESETMADYTIDLIGVPQTRIGGTVGSMNTATLLVAGAQANMGLWSLALVGVVAAGAAIIYKTKSKKTEQ